MHGLVGVFIAYLLAVAVIDLYSFFYSLRDDRLLLLAMLPFSLTPAPPALEMKQECKADVLRLLQKDATDAMDLVLKFSATETLIATPTNKAQLGDLAKQLSLAFESLHLISLGVQTNMFETSVHSCAHYKYLPFCPNVKPWLKTYCNMKGPLTCKAISQNMFIAAINPPMHDDELTVFYSETPENNQLTKVFSKRYYDNMNTNVGGVWTVQYDNHELFQFIANYYSPIFKDALGVNVQVYASIPLVSVPSIKMYLEENACS